ncbi:MAG: hypothetical protein CL489_17730 [Acidobacteria bacterium]|nr:hypothetical protein [Acidobacteriota bacterium]
MELNPDQVSLIFNGLSRYRLHLMSLPDVDRKKIKEIDDFRDLLMKNNMVLYPQLSEADKLIIDEKICPDCEDSLEYDQADPSGKDQEEWFCPNCADAMVSSSPNKNAEVVGATKQYIISFDRRETGVDVQEY